MASKDVIKLLRSHAQQAAKLRGEQATDFLSILKDTEREIVGRLATVPTTEFNASLLNRILAETRAAITGLEKKAEAFYTGASEAQTDLAVHQAVDEITRMSSLIDGVPLDLSLDAVAGVSSPSQMLLANHFESSVQAYGLDVLQAVRRKIQIGMITGNTSDVVKDVQKTIDGTKWQAERIVRTETSNAYGAARHASIDEASKQTKGGLKKVWVHQSSYKCDTCIGLDGSERPINGTWTIKIGKKSHKVAHPPAHPHCTCTILAAKPSWTSKLQRLGYL